MLRFMVRALAAWRLTELVVEDELTRPFREAVTKRWPESRAAYLTACPRCTSVWAAAAVLLMPQWMCTVLGLSGATMLANDVRDHAAQSALQRRMAAAGGTVGRQGETG